MNEKVWTGRLEDVIDRRKLELEQASKSERLNPWKNEPGEHLGKQARIDQVFNQDIIAGFFFFAKQYYSEYCTSEFAEFHYQLIEYAASNSAEFHLVAAPPEHGKSILLAIWKVYIGIRGLRHKHAQICENRTLAENNIAWVKQEFEMNWKLVHDFGNLVFKDHSYKDVFVVKNYDYDGTQKDSSNPYTGYSWFGHKGTLKGFLFYQYRIDSVEFDDYEPIATSKNKELVKEREDWIFSEVEGRTSKDSVMLWVHNNSRKLSCADNLHNNVSGRAKIFSHKYPAHDGAWNPLWPDHWSAEALQEKRLKVGSITWHGDWMQEPIIQGKIFKAEGLKRYRDLLEDLMVLGRIDFSPGFSRSASYKAIAMLGYSSTTRRYYILDAYVRQDTINRLIDACYQKYDDWSDRGLLNIKIEEDMRQDLVYAPYFEIKAKEKGFAVPIGRFTVKGYGEKDARVARMESPMQLGLMLWPEDLELDPDLNELLQHVLAWDYGAANKRLDGADALASAYLELEKLARAWSTERSNNYETVSPGEPRNI